MLKKERDSKIKTLATADTMFRIPISQGCVLTFPKGTMEPEENPGINGGNPWGSFTSKEGQKISFSQLTRIGNGINYGNISNPASALSKLMDMNDTQDIVLKVAKRIVMESTSREGKNCYLIFEPFNVA